MNILNMKFFGLITLVAALGTTTMLQAQVGPAGDPFAAPQEEAQDSVIKASTIEEQ